MVASDRKHAVPAQHIEVLRTGAIEEILPPPAAEPDIVAESPQHADHLLVQVARMNLVAVSFVVCIKLRNVKAGGCVV